MPAPDWVSQAVFYQIFPDRFARSEAAPSQPGLDAWGSPPTNWGFQGGDLRGIESKLEALADLGVNALYLNPIFEAASNHRYNTTDYYRIDRRLGSLQDFESLLASAHRRGFRVILDGVFNHCGRGFFAFYDLMEREAHSVYRDWFHVSRFPLEAYGSGKAASYRAWWDIKSLPKFNTSNPEVRRYLLEVARHWIERGADGWRLDVPSEIDDDSFWEELRAQVKGVNPEAYLVGEIWEADARWVGEGHFDGLMLYPLRKLVVDFVASRTLPAARFLADVATLTTAFPDGFRESHYLPLGSHDTERIRTVCGGDTLRVALAATLLCTFPGAPAIYYGDEIGLEGRKDPDSRRAFPWEKSEWDLALRNHWQKLLKIRAGNPALQRGEWTPLFASDESGSIAFARRAEGRTVWVAANASEGTVDLDLALDPGTLGAAARVADLLSGRTHSVQEGNLRFPLPPCSAAILVPEADRV